MGNKRKVREKMYQVLKFIFVGAIVALGIFLTACPKYALKEGEEANEQTLSSARKRGIVVMVLGIVVAIVLIIPMFLFS